MSKPCRYFNTHTHNGCEKANGCTIQHDKPIRNLTTKVSIIHPLAEIFTNEVINHPTGYKFNTVNCLDYPWIHECNLFFPTKNGNGWDEYGRKIPHPDDNKTFFLWRTYESYEGYDATHTNPEYIHSWWELFILDGTSRYNYQDEYPVEVLHEEDETPTDRQRRHLQYRKNLCIWGLLDCRCSSNGCLCLKLENQQYGCDYNMRQIVSISTDQGNTLSARMSRAGWDGTPIDIH